MRRSIGVGFIGAGPVTQAIHLPTLAALSGRFHVIGVMDIDAAVAEAVAARCGARSTTRAEDIYENESIEIVAICSPNAAHAEQVVACCRAGKGVVLCEKPLAVSRAESRMIAEAALETRTPIVVGTMHAFDPAWRAAKEAWDDAGEQASFVQSTIYLPSNDVFIRQATDPLVSAVAPQRRNGDLADPAIQASLLRTAMLGLAIHDVPLVRALYPSIGRLLSVRFLPPFGYSLSMTRADQLAKFLAMMPGQWPPDWSLRAIGQKHELRVLFPPSYVLAGSARVELVGGSGGQFFQSPISGYEAMWEHVAALAGQEGGPILSLEAILADLEFALDLADAIDLRLGR